MKTKHVKVLLSVAILALFAWAFASCSKKDNPTPTPVVVDKTALKAEIDLANTDLTAATEGTAQGQYPVGSKATLQTSVTLAQTVYDNSSASQSDVTTALANLTAAVTAFQAGVVAPIDAADLVAYWNFNEGTGTKAGDASGNGHDGTLMVPGAGVAVGTPGVPTWVSDRHGVAGHALHFTDGSHVEVPTSSALVPASITLTLWVYMDSLNTSTGVNSNNYMISENDYHTYKFQTQEAKKPFFTVATNTGIYDRDTNNGLANNLSLKKWYHFAVTYTSGTEVFYVNGQAVFTWTNVTGTIMNTATPDLFNIGANYSNAYYGTPGNAFTPNSNGTPAPVFFGTLDEVRVFKAALTAAQVLAIYNQEK